MLPRPLRTEDPLDELDLDGVTLRAELAVPEEARGVVVFVQPGSSVLDSAREGAVADHLLQHSFATLRVELLTDEERLVDEVQRHLRYDVDGIGRRVVAAIDWLGAHPRTADLSVGCLGIGVGAAAALVAAAERPTAVGAVVARGGRPDLAGEALARVRAPALFVVGGEDTVLEELSLLAMHRVPGETGFAVIPGTSHRFDHAAAFEEVTALTTDWFDQHLVRWMRRSGERVVAAMPRRPRVTRPWRPAWTSGPPSSTRGM